MKIINWLTVLSLPIIILSLFSCSSDYYLSSKELKLSEPKSLINLPAGPFIQYTTYWSKDGAQILLQRKTWTEEGVENKKREYWLFDSKGKAQENTTDIDFKDFEMETEDKNQPSVALKEDQIVWDICNSENIIISGTNIPETDNTTWEMNVWKNEELIGSFTFSSKQWMTDDVPHLSPQAAYSFSPNCEYFTVTLNGWTSWEIFGDEELWILDISKMSFSREIIGRSGFIKLWDDPVQSVIPNWSPIESKFVFGGGGFGVEIYDLETKRIKSLIEPRASAGWYQPQWSPSGNWIALAGDDKSHSVMVISQDGKHRKTAGACYLVDILWSPKKDNLAYLCRSDIYESKNVWMNLWIWNISESNESK
jgi:hypothetical protein